MKVKNLIFSMAYLIPLYPQGPPKLILGLWDSYKWCYDPKNMGEYPKNIWKMAIFWKSYTGQGQTACLLVKVVQFFIVMTALYPVFAPIRSGSSQCSLNLVIFLLFLAIFGGSFDKKLTWSDNLKCSACSIYCRTFRDAKKFFIIKKPF